MVGYFGPPWPRSPPGLTCPSCREQTCPNIFRGNLSRTSINCVCIIKIYAAFDRKLHTCIKLQKGNRKNLYVGIVQAYSMYCKFNVCTAMVMRVVSITSVSICQVSKHFFFCNTACFSICQKWKVIFKFDQDIQRDICQTRSPFKAFSRVEYVVRENQNRTAKWVRHNRVQIFLRADLFRFSCTFHGIFKTQ